MLQRPICLCCGQTRIHLRGDDSKAMKVKKDWARGHIIHAKYRGPDILENIRPICLECNINDKQFESNYHYMVYLGCMTEDEANRRVSAIRQLYAMQVNNLDSVKCIGVTQSGLKCTNERRPHELLCGVHNKNQEIHIARYGCNLLVGDFNRLKSLYFTAMERNDKEDMHFLKARASEIKSLIFSLKRSID